MAASKMVPVVVLMGVWASCLAVPQYPPPHPPRYTPAPSYKEPARPYSYSYSVNDEYKGLHISAGETSNGASVQGSYQVALPDGRLQNVAYNADHYAGYNADVTYTGEAQHPHEAPRYLHEAARYPHEVPSHPPAHHG
ncbi:cuticle protein 7-like isoform X2 [Homarus americanus]|uniref:cuticle protein 7-like isoform X2 n=1 Tax=Homarus americanus TaxID=6706 RepID=UPI001C479FA5|nr:cuticle protein 7-like isoform X2 [Homarus americanus]